MEESRIHRYGFLAGISLVIILFDQATKAYIMNTMHLHQSISIIQNFFSLTYIRNPGAAFGILAQSSGTFRTIFFGVTSVFALGLLGTIFIRLEPDDWWGQLTIVSIFGGAIGNLIDRLQFGEVVDFLDFYVNGYHWPAFNVADSAISVGVVSLLVLFAVDKKKVESTSESNPQEPGPPQPQV